MWSHHWQRVAGMGVACWCRGTAVMMGAAAVVATGASWAPLECEGLVDRRGASVAPGAAGKKELVQDWLGQEMGDNSDDGSATGQPEMIVFSGSSNPDLANEVAGELDVKLGRIESNTFADGERFVKVGDSVRGKHVFIIQSTSPPVNEHLMELLLIISTMRRASAKTITAVVPYYGYKRSTGAKGKTIRARAGRGGLVEFATPMCAADVAVMLECMGVDSVISVDLQPPGEGQIEGFFGSSVRVDNLRSTATAVEHLARHPKLMKPAIVASNEPCVELAHDVRSGLEKNKKEFIPFAGIVRTEVTEGRKQYQLVGDVKDRDVVIVDDIIDTGVRLVESVKLLKDAGARRVMMFATHAVFSKDAIELIADCKDLDEVIVTNTIPLRNDTDVVELHKVSQLSVAPVIAKSIDWAHRNRSLQALRVYDRDNERPRYGGQE